MAREIESFSVWAPKNLHAESDIAWVQNYLHEKGEISLHGPVDLDRLIRAGVQLEKSDSGRNGVIGFTCCCRQSAALKHIGISFGFK
ncbi:hypothetical protein, partial [Pseudomonas aeruginosa]|uniref:hypothetical protein n=1 Tax=Pseudomonas aeruginosa TaxID=287 RepID=UPI001C0F9A00